MPEMSKGCICIATPPQSATCLLKQKTCQGDAEDLALIAYFCMGLGTRWLLMGKDSDNIDKIVAALEHHDRVCQIDLGSVPSSLLLKDSVMMKSFPVLTHVSLLTVVLRIPDLEDPFLGGYATSTRTYLGWDSISGITETTLVYQRPRRASPSEYSSFCIHVARSNGHLPILLNQIRKIILRLLFR